MIGNVAHDLKTPLQSVGMSIELLRSDLVSAMSAKPAATIEMQQAINETVLSGFVVTLDRCAPITQRFKLS